MNIQDAVLLAALDDDRARTPRELSPRGAAVMVVLAWVPAALLAASLPRFVTVLDRWHWPLPTLTLALREVGRQGYWFIVLAEVGLVAALACCCASWVRADLPFKKSVVFMLAGFGVVVVFPVLMWGTMGPVLTAPIGR